MRRFQRTVENFTCAHCAASVVGDGYTNHCPHCLWSVHVDINPGDRASVCHGLMEPISVEQKSDVYQLTHRCVQCGHTKRNRTQSDDAFDVLLAIVRAAQ